MQFLCSVLIIWRIILNKWKYIGCLRVLSILKTTEIAAREVFYGAFVSMPQEKSLEICIFLIFRERKDWLLDFCQNFSNWQSFCKKSYFLCNLSFAAGILKSEPLLLPGRHALNLGMLLGNVGAMGCFLYDNTPSVGLGMLGITSTLSSVMGVTLTAAIGGTVD